MARYEAKGIEGLDLEDFLSIPDDVVEEMLMAEGAVVKEAQKASLRNLGLVDTNTLADSIRVSPKVRKMNDMRYVLVGPYGPHHIYNRRRIVKAYARSKHGRTYTVGGGTAIATANDVGFVHEFGADGRGIKASQWMRLANEKSEDEATQAAYAVYDAWLKTKGL